MASEQMQIGPWVVEVDREATEALYAEVTDGAEECTCYHCQHWSAHRDAIYPDPARRLLADMGIDYRREAEVYELNPEVEGHSCSGWFHFVGRIVSGPTTEWVKVPLGAVGKLPDATPLTDDFGVYFSGGMGPMKAPMDAAHSTGVPLVQLEFTTSRHRLDPT